MNLLLDPSVSLFVSTVSTLEMARLAALGRLVFAIDLPTWVEKSLRLLGAETVQLTHAATIEAYRLPEPFHRDPVDRLLVAAARIFGFRLLTADDLILGYPAVPSHDART